MKIKRLIANILLLTMILSAFPVFAQESTRDESMGPGYDAGFDDGRDYVRYEYRAGSVKEDLPLDPDLPSVDYIERKHGNLMNRLTQSQQKKFFDDYDLGYIAGYKEEREYLFGSDDESSLGVEVNYAESLGSSLGEIFAYNDFYDNKRSNWSRAIPSNREIISIFDLNRETSQYRSAFIAEFRNEFQIAYEEAFEFALLNNIDTILGSAVTNGKDLGLALGSLYGDRDYFEGRTNNYERDLPSDSTIIGDYQLNRFLDEYKSGFVDGFKLGYEEGYNTAYYNSYKEAVDSGRNAGALKGEMMATKDYIENKDMDWTRHKSLSSQVSSEYKLIYLSNSYRASFLNGFWLGFAERYEETYRVLIGEQVSEKIAFTTMTIAGGELSAGDSSISVNIQSGTFYNDIALSLERIFSERYKIDESRYIKASDIYNIQISNPSDNLDNSKSITMSMEYYGKNDGGIYKWVDGKWNYINSTINEGRIIADINPNTLKTGDNLYCILVDRDNDILTDVRGHWAKDEINALVRRNIITGYPDETFKPDRNISRAEFLTLLSKMYNWNLPRDTDNISTFDDYQRFGIYDKYISYGINAGYIVGYPDNTFKPNLPISYKEVEIIMGRVHNDPDFKWYNTSAKMLYEKQIKSKSYNDMNNKITRAEVAYMLYILNEWRY